MFEVQLEVKIYQFGLLFVHENTIYNINRFVLQETGGYLEGVLQSWIIVQLLPLKRFGSECKICYKNGVQSFPFFNTNPYH